MKFIYTLLFLGISNFTLGQDVSKELNIDIYPYKEVTNGAFFQVIHLYSPDCYVEYLKDFDYKWGYFYRLRVKETHLQNPPSDGSSYMYELLEVISKRKAPKDYTFQMGLSRDLYLGNGPDQVNNFKWVNDTTYLYMDEIYIEYSSNQSPLFDQVFQQDSYLKATFEMVNDSTIRLK